MNKTIAVMQPYLFPYLPYFALFAAADEFVVYDCVQFPRRGRVHRCSLRGWDDWKRWFTLPLQKLARDGSIRELAWREGAERALAEQMRRFPVFWARDPIIMGLTERAHMLEESPVDYLCRRMADVCSVLGLETRVTRSSRLGISSHLKGAARVRAIVHALGGTQYINLPGGRELYDHAAFAHDGLRLRFLPVYKGSYESVLDRLRWEAPDALADELKKYAEAFE